MSCGRPRTSAPGALLAVVAMAGLISCGGGSGGTSTVSSSNSSNTSDTSASSSSSTVVSISPTSASVVVLHTQQFTATVTGTTNTAVTWQVDGMTHGNSTVGSIDNNGLYTAPAAIASSTMDVTVSAVSQADTSKSAAAAVTILEVTPVVVTILPTLASVGVGATKQFTATVSGTSNTAVTWQVNDAPGGNSTVGTIDSSGLYTAPAVVPNPANVTVKAVSQADPSQAASATVIITSSVSNESLLDGAYAFLFNGFNAAGPVVVGGTFTADGNGTITAGHEDINLNSGVTPSLALVGTYTLGSDDRGAITFVTSQGNARYRFVMNARGDGTFIEFDDADGTGTRGSGVFKKQDANAFLPGAFSGDFAFGLAGDLAGAWTAMAGRFTSSTAGVLSNGAMDVNTSGANYEGLAVAGNLNPADSSGRGTAAWSVSGLPATLAGTYRFAYYIVSTDEALLVEMDNRSSTTPALSGSLRKQSGGPFSEASFSNAVVFNVTGLAASDAEATVAVGQLVPDGAGNLTATLDAIDSHSVSANVNVFAVYSIGPNGRGVISGPGWAGPTSLPPLTLYMISPNRAFILGGTAAAPSAFAFTGQFEPQTGGPFDTSTFAGAFTVGRAEPAIGNVMNINGALALSGSGNMIGTVDTSQASGLTRDQLVTGTYQFNGSSTGRGAATSPVFGMNAFGVYAVSAGKFVAAVPTGPGYSSVVIVFEK
jgi:hypothetical protein